ncbi:hypothetical protein GALMADRAFT_880188 [Galerina marginata CBS 339.88]|uniref:Uncharacterized protein n=1 Tax=Galerina marginata (strain CBS 339.88) TaxID=685588 RepID=A0A067SSJ2_GALM3|nr:hypothetical protein GALMADRAFT_880188 [Galerina marginata CBS 339.88]
MSPLSPNNWLTKTHGREPESCLAHRNPCQDYGQMQERFLLDRAGTTSLTYRIGRAHDRC